MARPRKTTFPKYPTRAHASGQARIRLPGGRCIYLGPWGSPASHARYAAEAERWKVQQSQGAKPGNPGLAPCAIGLTVTGLVDAFHRHAERHYRHPDGRPTSELANLRDALRPLLRLHGTTLASDFGPLKLKAVREAMVKQGLTRKSVNKRIDRIRRAFRWAASEELVPASVPEALRTVAGLQAGRTDAPEAPAVGPVPLATVEATLPHLPPVVAAMVRVQLLTGMRPGEVRELRGCDLDRDTLSVEGRPVWVYRPPAHKTSWRGQSRAVVLGPQAQAVLAPYLERDPGACCFSPREAVAEYRRRQRAARRSKVQPSQEDRSRVGARGPGAKYTATAYIQAIGRACDRAGVPRWAPNRLRHAAATLIQREAGLDGARSVLGHKDARVTTIYAERDLHQAAEIAARIG